jgi:hypothetical protein
MMEITICHVNLHGKALVTGDHFHPPHAMSLSPRPGSMVKNERKINWIKAWVVGVESKNDPSPIFD